MIGYNGKKSKLKAVILAGGYGTRISEESYLKPKPMIEIGGKPILWHILKIYSNYDINEFIICCGYKANKIKEYFDRSDSESWNIQLVDTGLDTMTGGRLKRIQDYVDDTFCVTYGDGLSNIDINNLISFHREKKSLATLTAIHPPERFGVLNLSGDYVTEFHEKHSGESSWINGGFFVFEPEIFDYLRDDSTVLEKTPLETLAKEKKLSAFKHNGFWHPMDTLRDKKHLENLWSSKKAPWKTW
jgi:glucose-1-phosphate cytidylyltransferase